MNNAIRSAIRPAIALIFVLSLANFCDGQQQPRTTIQLPVLSFFRGITTINVPDRGQALIGSVKRSATGTVSRGVPILGNVPYAGRLFNNRATGSNQSASTLSATVQIYDLNEMDKAILAEARRDRVLKIGGPAAMKRKEEKSRIKQKADFITRNLGRNSNSNR